MPVRVVCKACSASLTAPDSAAGKAVVCPKCKASLVVPAADAGYEVVDDEPTVAKPKLPTPKRRVIDDDYDYDRPRKKKKPEPKGVPAWAIIVPIFLVLLLIAGAIAAWYFWPKAKVVPGAPTPAPISGPAPVVWTPFTSPDGSFVASFPNGPPQQTMDGGAEGSGLTLPGLPGFGGAAGQGGKASDIAKDMGIELGVFNRIDPVGTFNINYAAMPAALAAPQTVESLWKDVKPGKQPNGSEIMIIESANVGGHPGKRMVRRNGSHLMESRTTVVKGRVFTVTATVPTDANESPLITAFFDAFAIKNVPDPKPLNLPGLEIPKDLDPLKKS